MTANQDACDRIDCSARLRPCGCGWLGAGQPCGNPRQRDEWKAAIEALMSDEARDCAEMTGEV